MKGEYHNPTVHLWLAALACGVCGALGCAIGDVFFVPDEPTIIGGQFTWPSRVPVYIGAMIGGTIGGVIGAMILRTTRIPD